MRVAFVGIEKDWQDLKNRDYVEKFVKYHLELPWYYAEHGGNVVDVVSNYDSKTWRFESGGECTVISRGKYDILRSSYDVVVHWRKWLDELYCENAVNVINSQDHSYGNSWLESVNDAVADNKLYGILCFPEWHERNLEKELSVLPHNPRLLSGVTLGVDTDIYRPAARKSPY